MVNLHTASGFEALLGPDTEASPYEYGMLFEARGWFARRRAKARFKLLRKIDPKLRRVLRPDERVYYVSTGAFSKVGEQFFEGHAAAYYVNLRALVFTTERVIFMQIGANQKPRDLVSELSYALLREVKATWTGMCQLTLSNGKKHNLKNMPKADRKYLHGFLNGVVAQAGAETAALGALAKGADGLMHLCPHCFAPVPGRPTDCPACGGGIRSANTAGLLSLLFPGLGDWYLGHRGFAVLEMAGAGFLWFALVILPLLSGRIGSEDPRAPDGGYWAMAAIFLCIAHGVDAVMTRSYGLKGHHPGKPPTGMARV